MDQLRTRNVGSFGASVGRVASLDSSAMSERQNTQWLSSAEAAELLGVGTRTLYRFIDEGRLPAYRFGRVIRLQRSDVESFVSSCRIEPGSLDHLHPELLATEISVTASNGM